MLLSCVFALRTITEKCLEKYVEEIRSKWMLEPDYLSSNLDSTTYCFVEVGPLVSSVFKIGLVIASHKNVKKFKER